MTFDLFDVAQLMPLLAAAIGAFFGGIAAFVVSQLNERVKRHRKRWVEHRNALVRLEFMLNDLMDVTASNKYIAGTAIAAVEKEDLGLSIVWNEPHLLIYDPSLIASFLRPELINELFSYGVEIRRLNSDTDTVCKAYSEMRSGLLRQDLTSNQYRRSLVEFGEGMKNLINEYNLIYNRTEALLARTRVAFSKDKHYDSRSFFSFLYSMPAPNEVSVADIDSELIKLRAEIAEVQSKSRAAIKTLLGKSSSRDDEIT